MLAQCFVNKQRLCPTLQLTLPEQKGEVVIRCMLKK